MFTGNRINTQSLYSKIATGAKQLGRSVTRVLLCLYFVLKNGNIPAKEKLLIYAGILYVVVPNDLLPRRVFHAIGITDDIFALAFVFKKVKSHITPQMVQEVDKLLDKWFGYDISYVDEQ